MEQCGVLCRFSGLEEADSKRTGVVKHNGCVGFFARLLVAGVM